MSLGMQSRTISEKNNVGDIIYERIRASIEIVGRVKEKQVNLPVSLPGLYRCVVEATRRRRYHARRPPPGRAEPHQNTTHPL